MTMTGALDPHPVLAAGAVGPSGLWYATRATGMVALVLLTLTVALGIAGAARMSSPRWPRMVTAGLHRNLSLLVVAFVALHVLTAVLDSFVSIGFLAAIVPFTADYRPLWLSLGAIAFDLILALVATSLVRTRLSYRAWRAVHWLAYAAWPIALWHGLGTGTDTRLTWILAVDGMCMLVVAAAVLARLRSAPPGPARTAALAATALIPLATIAFVVAGPGRPGWSHRAGTPPPAAVAASRRPQ